MEKKNNKGMYVILGILSTLVVVLIVAVVALAAFFYKEYKSGEQTAVIEETVDDSKDREKTDKKKTDKKDSDREDTSRTPKETEEGLFGYFANEIQDDENSVNANAFKIVVDGFRMMVPLDYNCYYDQEAGVVVYMDDVFHMKVAVTEKGFDVIKADPQKVTEKTIAAGGEILQDVKFTEVDGKEYAYFLMNLDDADFFVGYTQAANQDCCVGVQLLMEKADLSEKDLLNIFASVASTATVTDEANSTQEDIEKEMKNANFGTRKTESTITYKGEEVTFEVPTEFYSVDAYEGDNYVMEMFSTTDYIETNCYLISTIDEGYDNAEAYILNEADFASVQSASIEEKKVNGVSFYWFKEDYEYEGSHYQKICAACDIGEDSIYAIHTEAIDVDRDVKLKQVEAFMNVK